MDIGSPLVLGLVNSDDFDNVQTSMESVGVAATWYDDTQRCFISMLENDNDNNNNNINNSTTSGSTSIGDDSSDNCNDSHILSLKILNFQETRDGKEQDFNASNNTLHLHVRLPRSLMVATSTVVDGSSQNDPLLSASTSSVTTAYSSTSSASATGHPRLQHQDRILKPVLVRISLDCQLLAIQFSPTMVRIVPVISSSATKIKHWTIDISTGDPPNPKSSSPSSLPQMKSKKSRENRNKRIIPKGVIWSDHGGSSQELILVTNQAVFCYKVSLSRNQMSLTHSFPNHDSSNSTNHCSAVDSHTVWWEPISRALVVGSPVSLQNDSFSSTTEGEQVEEDDNAYILDTFFLNFAKTNADQSQGASSSALGVFHLPRFELPPPVRIPQFSITGQSCLGNRNHGKEISSPLSNDNTSTSLAEQISLVNIFGEPHIVAVLGVDSPNTYRKEQTLFLSFYRLCRTDGPVVLNPCLKVIIPESCQLKIGNDHQSEKILITVMDHIICMTFRRSKVHVFVDLAEMEVSNRADDCYVVQRVRSGPEELFCDGLEECDVSFLHPSFIYLEKYNVNSAGRSRGLVVHSISVDLERLASAIIAYGCNFNILLRRGSSSSSEPYMNVHEIALRRFADVVAIPCPNKRQKLINEVAAAYSKGADSNAVNRDWDATMRLIFQCALLPYGAEFRYCGHAGDGVWLHSQRAATALANAKEQSSITSCKYAILSQKDILENVLLPKAREALKSSDSALLRSVGDVAVSYMCALDHFRDCPPCPALECLVVAILWRLGCDHEILQMLRSRSSSSFCSKQRFYCDNKNFDSSSTINVSAEMLSTAIMAITSEVEFGSGALKLSRNCCGKAIVFCHDRKPKQRTHLLDIILKESLFLCSSRSSNPVYVVKHLLSQKRLADAISVCSKIAISPDKIHQTVDFDFLAAMVCNSAGDRTFVEAKRENSGDDFVRTAIELLLCDAANQLQQPIDTDILISQYRTFRCLFTFLSFWDPKYLQKNGISPSSSNGRTRMKTKTQGAGCSVYDDTAIQRMFSSSTLLKLSSSLPSSSQKIQSVIRRRPSWLSTGMDYKKQSFGR